MGIRHAAQAQRVAATLAFLGAKHLAERRDQYGVERLIRREMAIRLLRRRGASLALPIRPRQEGAAGAAQQGSRQFLHQNPSLRRIALRWRQRTALGG